MAIEFYIKELLEFDYSILIHYDFLHTEGNYNVYLDAVFCIVEKENFDTRKSYAENLKKSKVSKNIQLPISAYGSIRNGSVFKNGKSVDLNEHWYEKLILKSCNLHGIKSISLKEYYKNCFGKNYYRYLPEEYKDLKVIIYNSHAQDKNRLDPDIDIIIPCSILMTRFCGITNLALKNILYYGLPDDHTNPIFLSLNENHIEDNEIKIGLRKNILSSQASFWAQFIFYPSLRESVNYFKENARKTFMNDQNTYIPIEFEWPFNESIDQMEIYGRGVVYNNRVFYVASLIGGISNNYVKSGIKVTYLRDNDGRKKENKENAKKVSQDDTTFVGVTKDNLTKVLNTPIDQNYINNVTSNKNIDFLYRLPEAFVMDVKDQKWLTNKIPRLKKFLNSGNGEDTSDSDQNENNENPEKGTNKEEIDEEIEDDDYYSLFNSVAVKLKLENKLEEFLFLHKEFSKLKSKHDYHMLYWRMVNIPLTNEQIRFCFKPTQKNIKLNSVKRRRKYYVLEVKENCFVLEIEPQRGASCLCFYFKNLTLEDVEKYVIKYIEKCGNMIESEERTKLIRIIHPLKLLKNKELSLEKNRENYISSMVNKIKKLIDG